MQKLTKGQYEALTEVLGQGYGPKDGFAIENVAQDQPEMARSLRNLVRSGALVQKRDDQGRLIETSTHEPPFKIVPDYVLTDETVARMRQYEQAQYDAHTGQEWEGI